LTFGLLSPKAQPMHQCYNKYSHSNDYWQLCITEAQAPVFQTCDSSQKSVHGNAGRKSWLREKGQTEFKIDRRQNRLKPPPNPPTGEGEGGRARGLITV